MADHHTKRTIEALEKIIQEMQLLVAHPRMQQKNWVAKGKIWLPILHNAKDDLEHYIGSPISKPQELQSPKSALHKKVFIVHGHDLETRDQIKGYIESLGLETIVLMEKPNLGRTIIEKFEDASNEVGFAIVILTPDDVGAAKTTPTNFKARARQNVIYELGYFAGKLSRSRVCALVDDLSELEIPSDIQGVGLISLKDNWQSMLQKELEATNLIK